MNKNTARWARIIHQTSISGLIGMSCILNWDNPTPYLYEITAVLFLASLVILLFKASGD
jgi:hypothetical protein